MRDLQQHNCSSNGGGVMVWRWVGFISCLVLTHPRVSEGCIEEERRALLHLRDSLYQPGGAVNESVWSWAGRDCCQWEGVACQEGSVRRRVEVIVFANRRPPELGGWSLNASLLEPFTYLTELSLVGNQINGWLSPIGDSRHVHLQRLYLNYNGLTDEGVRGILNHTSLIEVNLMSNMLRDASIIKGLCRMNLESLNLGQNMIEGVVDPCLGQLHNLQELSLNHNYFTGNIPPIFSNLTSIQSIYLNGNQFTGVLSFSTLANLTNLSFLSLSSNCELQVETETPTWVPTFQLSVLYLLCCNLNKNSNFRGIPRFLSTQDNLLYLDLSFTSLQGSIPPWILYNVNYNVRLMGNNLTGPLPQLHPNRTLQLQVLDISKNKISSPFPKNMSSVLPNLINLNLSMNAFDGSTLSSFGELTFLEVLDLSYNGLIGGIPPSLTRNGTRLRNLMLTNNNLVGDMLPMDSCMTDLHYLHLENNQFTGEISRNLSNSRSLISLNLRGNQITGMIPGELSVFLDMNSLLLSRNHLQGSIPEQLCRIQGLQILDLSDNSLSGLIPHCLNNVTVWKEQVKNGGFPGDNSGETIKVDFTTKGMSYSYLGPPLWMLTGIDLSKNRFSGSIPIEMGDLKALRSLNLSNNQLSGYIPASFKGLETIESLDLSHNQLVGNVPAEMISLHDLSTFSVAYNHLSGALPFDNQFSTFSKSSFEGNPGLCGRLIGRDCSLHGTKQGDGSEEEGKEAGKHLADNKAIYFMFLAASWGIGFWCFMGALALNMNLKIMFLEAVDEWTDPLVEKVIEFKSYLEKCLCW